MVINDSIKNQRHGPSEQLVDGRASNYYLSCRILLENEPWYSLCRGVNPFIFQLLLSLVSLSPTLTMQVTLVQTFQELFYFLHVGNPFLFVLPSLSPTLAVQITLVQTFQELFHFLHVGDSFLFSSTDWNLILCRICCIIFLSQVLSFRLSFQRCR